MFSPEDGTNVIIREKSRQPEMSCHKLNSLLFLNVLVMGARRTCEDFFKSQCLSRGGPVYSEHDGRTVDSQEPCVQRPACEGGGSVQRPACEGGGSATWTHWRCTDNKTIHHGEWKIWTCSCIIMQSLPFSILRDAFHAMTRYTASLCNHFQSPE
jgi:hypothetical protein